MLVGISILALIMMMTGSIYKENHINLSNGEKKNTASGSAYAEGSYKKTFLDAVKYDDLDVDKLYTKAVEGCGLKETTGCALVNIVNFLHEKIKINADFDNVPQMPVVILSKGEADIDDMNALLASLLVKAGIQPYYVFNNDNQHGSYILACGVDPADIANSTTDIIHTKPVAHKNITLKLNDVWTANGLAKEAKDFSFSIKANKPVNFLIFSDNNKLNDFVHKNATAGTATCGDTGIQTFNGECRIQSTSDVLSIIPLYDNTAVELNMYNSSVKSSDIKSETYNGQSCTPIDFHVPASGNVYFPKEIYYKSDTHDYLKIPREVTPAQAGAGV